jgi:hypothetical protein
MSDSKERPYRICSLNDLGEAFVVERHYGTFESANERGAWLMVLLGLSTVFFWWD